MEFKFYSNGKLLITGEYAVLDGAKALAIPTIFGQSLTVIETDTKAISWRSMDEKDEVWFNAEYSLEGITEISSSHSEISKTLHNILIEAQKLNPRFLKGDHGYTLESKLTFPRDWGLGSSSTLINNIAQWANVNPFHLSQNTLGGSGYDIACAHHNTPIVYQRTNNEPVVHEVSFNPDFKDQLFFIHLNKKQNSREGISQYRQVNSGTGKLVHTISELTSKIVSCRDLATFESLLDKHENILSKTLKKPTVKKSLFTNYTGSIKSLGAWGGDFILATGDKASMAYFTQRGYRTIIPFSEMIL
ncbi:MAG: GHMP kinase [Maribacter sp.]|nr:GHMP kinase [Maribacter sp.]